MIPLTSYLGPLKQRQDLTQEEMRTVMLGIMRRTWPDEQVAEFLLALRAKGESRDEVAGAVSALRELMTKIVSRHPRLIDTCGTGGDGHSTFNVSTAAALVTAACGLPVAKHGNRGVSSRSGSADVLRLLGVHVEAPLPVVERCLNELGICFCFAPLWHPSVRSVSEIRRQLGVPTIFNWIGPLCNPAEATCQLIGVGRPDLRRVIAEVAACLGTERTVVVHGHDGLDEVTIAGDTFVSGVLTNCATDVAGATDVAEMTWTPELFGLPGRALDGARVDSPEESAGVIRQVFAGEPGVPRDLVVLNAAAALWTGEVDPEFVNCRIRAESAIDDGSTQILLSRLGELSHKSG